MGKSSAQKATEKNQLDVQKANMEQMREGQRLQTSRLGQEQGYRDQIDPYATQLMGLAQQALGGNIPPGLIEAFLGPQRQGLQQDFEQSRNNLTEALGSQGLSGSGLGIGPQANLYASEAAALGNARSNATLQAMMTALQGGQQGAALLGGQQQLLNPLAYGTQGLQAGQQVSAIDPRQYGKAGTGLLGGILGTGLSAVTGGILGGRGGGGDGNTSARNFNQPATPDYDWRRQNG